MTIMKNNTISTSPGQNNPRRRHKLGALLSSQDNQYHDIDVDRDNHRHSSRRNSDASAAPALSTYTADMYYSNPNSATSSPYLMSPWSQLSPYIKSPWIHLPNEDEDEDEDDNNNTNPKHGLIGSLLRQEGHIYSLAAYNNYLFTGSDSKNVRVWKNLGDSSGFKSSSGFVKAIVVIDNKIFTGHQDGKIRIWKMNKSNVYKRVGNLPTTRDLLMKSMNPKNYVEVRRKHNVPWVKHYDAVSCMSIDYDQGLLYSGSWDKTLKVWRISDSKCMESIQAHDDALNSVVVAFDGVVFTGSADGTMKAWRRERVGRSTQHVLVETLLRQDHALTSLAVNHEAGAVYAGSSDGLVSFWERGKHFMSYGGVLRGHKIAVLCLGVGGSLVMSGSADSSICVWRRNCGGVHACVAVLTGHSGPVKCLAVEKDAAAAAAEVEEEESDERWIVYSGSLDKSVKVWRVSENSCGIKESQEV
ncbi:hypothetical protein BUALT_Bualt15G0030700 [Buddleja alternifolia]|uniref:Uncharacterized protein n=1 Tax=Buddleja alternifolia TaxID=168488 RepID=A0AAV6WJX4_9LAMI|nr:hypothetical protein BUALT_Bualt15G0030700 [Buddleja alternifolia]